MSVRLHVLSVLNSERVVERCALRIVLDFRPFKGRNIFAYHLNVACAPQPSLLPTLCREWGLT